MRTERLIELRRPLTLLALLTVSQVGLFLTVYWVAVRTVPGRELGDASLRGALLTRSRLTGPVDRVLDVVSVASLSAAVAVIAVIALVRLVRLPGLAAIGVLIGSNVSTLVLKNVVLDRPDLGIPEVTPATLNSLPSGHATAAFSAVAAVLFVLPRVWRPSVVVLGAAYGAVTALATMSAGWHRASDSIAAFLVVGAWSAAAATALLVLDPEPSRRHDEVRTRSAALHWLSAGALASLVLGTILVLMLTVAAPVRDTTAGSAGAFLAGALLIAGTSALVLIVVLTSLDLADADPAPR